MGNQTMQTELKVVPLASVGVRIDGLDLSRLDEPAVRTELYDIWLEHGIVLFRGTGAGREQHLKLSRVFGELEVHPIPRIRVPGQEDLVEIREEGGYYMVEGQLVGGFIPWHQDTCYTPDICKGAVLYMDTPAENGGQTGWIDTAKAFDALPTELREQAEGKEVTMFVHNAKPDGMRFVQHERSFRRPTDSEWAGENLAMPKFPPVVHPLVITHPESGRKSLSISPSNVEAVLGMSRDQSEKLLRALTQHVLQPQFRYVHQWEQGDMMLWDNRRTLHQAYGWPVGVSRKAFRTTLEGAMRSGRYLEADELGYHP